MQGLIKQILIILFILINNVVFSQIKFKLSGSISDTTSSENLIGATLLIKELGTGTATDVNGNFAIELPKGSYHIVFSFLGYQSVTKKIQLNKNLELKVVLKTDSKNLEEFEISSERANRNVESVQMSKIELSQDFLKKIPALLGEVDLLRAIQLLPGVQSGGEGSSGFFVRGGNVSQNLILLDDAVVYNASHLFGIYSVFNADAIKSADLYKGGIPSRFGGRLSSVLDVHLKEGNQEHIKISGGIGVISSKLTIEAPIIKGKSSIIVSGRRMYADQFLRFSSNPDIKNSALYFYDLNGKFNYRFNNKNKLELSAYSGRDILGIANLFKIGWGNTTTTLKWNHIFNDKLSSKLEGIRTAFSYNIGIPKGTQAFDWTSSIKDYTIKNQYNYFLNKNNKIRAGFSATLHRFSPATFKPVDPNNETLTARVFPNRYALESGIYASNEQRMGARIVATYGVRISAFQNIGIDTIFNFNPITHDTIAGDSYTAYGPRQFFNKQLKWEPRLGIKYTLDDQSSIKFSYNRIYQYLHLASNSSNSAPWDLWIPSSVNVKPEKVDQYALGYFRNLRNNSYEISAETYYKLIDNQLDVKGNAQLLFNRLIEGEFRIGKAKSYGLELFVRKQKGKFTGWISYTLSKTTVTIPGINKGKTYFANYDRRHNFSFVSSYDFTKRISISATWVFYSGSPITTPVGKYQYQGVQIPLYSDRNSQRMPSYHRMDLSITFKNKKIKENQRYESSWNVSVYNAYARKNPFTITFAQNANDPKKSDATMTYLFGILPSITYSFKF